METTHWEIRPGDCRERLQELPEGSVDAVVCDPPYGLEFMGAAWDRPWAVGSTGSAVGRGMREFQAWCEAWAAEVRRVLKPGGHLLAFGGTRTYHRLAAGIEDAGFEIRECLVWLYGSGFPKSLNVGQAIARRECATEAEAWDGWGTALKPAHEPIVLARKPLAGTVAENVLEHGVGGLNVAACQVDAGGERGRWPANVVLDEAAAGLLDEQSGILTSGAESPDGHLRRGDKFRTAYGTFAGKEREHGVLYGDSGGASRFFYCAKSSRRERDAGLEQQRGAAANLHPTVKPISLMRWLVRLVTPSGGLVLDPFAGSGTTGCAAVLEGLDFIGVERDREYVRLSEARIDWWHRHRGTGAAEMILAAGEIRDRVERDGQLSMLGGEGS